MSILITGGAGYIGSHVSLELLRLNHKIIIVDNLSSYSTGYNVDALKNKYSDNVTFYKCDIRDYNNLTKIFTENTINCVIHFAGLKSVKESTLDPFMYYHNNVMGTLVLLEVMKNHQCYNLIFSSSATIYGISEKTPIYENFPIKPINPYGQTKAMIETILNDLPAPWKIINLRYFNPVGLDSSGLLKEESHIYPENLFPYVIKVIKGNLETLTIFGNDYHTRDGTPIRDYIHITDLSLAHISAFNHIDKVLPGESESFNIGTGTGYTVLEIIDCFQKLGNPVNYRIGDRRDGDAAESYACSDKAYEVLGWKATKTLSEMCQDSLL